MSKTGCPATMSLGTINLRLQALNRTFLVTFVLPALVCARYLEAAAHDPTHVDLRIYGWTMPDPIHFKEFDPVGSSNLIAIDHENRIIVGFTKRRTAGLVNRAEPALDFNIVRLSLNGTADLHLRLATNNWRRNSLYVTPRDHIVARANDVLQFLNSTTQGDADSNRWREIFPCELRCHIYQSGTRATLLLTSPTESTSDVRVDVSGEPSTELCQGTPRPVGTVTDTHAYMLLTRFAPGTLQQTAVLQSWPVCNSAQASLAPACLGGRAIALNESEAAVGGVHAIGVLQFDGKCKFVSTLAKREMADKIRGDEKGDRFAVDVSSYAGGSAALDISGHRVKRRVSAFVSDTGNEIANVSISPTQNAYFDFALSPDGRHLVILLDRDVQILDLE